ncbi:MAG TPA: biotin--[acetyl-CoA-carboxylase] ligase, partial [Vicinamibacterales bacterium]|nr:biotin--[acetyl-CoA-carboxylase] ligase [Vicinamibacterales bacterium]
MSASAGVPPALGDALQSNADRIRPFGSRLVHLAEVGSTNDVAAVLASGDTPEGTLVIADAQTAGRGRMGHSWYSPPGAGLYVSVVLRPPRTWLTRAPGLVNLVTLTAGVAVAEGLRTASGIDAAIKWPNDIVVGRGRSSALGEWRKIAGILAEGAATGGELQHVVLGYGVNLLRVEYPPELAERATSIEQEIGRRVERITVLVETLAVLSQGYAGLAEGRAEDVIARWRALSPSCEGAPVAWTGAAGRAVGVT